jgi:hypothetical protein
LMEMRPIDVLVALLRESLPSTFAPTSARRCSGLYRKNQNHRGSTVIESFQRPT